MAKLEYKTLSNRTVEKLQVQKDTVFWDHELTGFGVQGLSHRVARCISPRPGDRGGRSGSRWVGTECSARSRRVSGRP